MVRVGHMGVRMAQRLVVVPVAMFAGRHRVMHMIVMSVIVTVRVFMLHAFVLMLVAVRFH